LIGDIGRVTISESSFPYRVFDRKAHPNILKQILEDKELLEQMREILAQEGSPYPFCHRKIQKGIRSE
jgi:hypothetical protein